MHIDTLIKQTLEELTYTCPVCNGWGALYVIKTRKNNKKGKIKCMECNCTGRISCTGMSTFFKIGVKKYMDLMELWAKANGYKWIKRPVKS